MPHMQGMDFWAIRDQLPPPPPLPPYMLEQGWQSDGVKLVKVSTAEPMLGHSMNDTSSDFESSAELMETYTVLPQNSPVTAERMRWRLLANARARECKSRRSRQDLHGAECTKHGVSAPVMRSHPLSVRVHAAPSCDDPERILEYLGEELRCGSTAAPAAAAGEAVTGMTTAL